MRTVITYATSSSNITLFQSPFQTHRFRGENILNHRPTEWDRRTLRFSLDKKRNRFEYFKIKFSGCAVALALIMFQREEEADSLIEQLLLEQDPILRYGGALVIAMAYCGTSSSLSQLRSSLRTGYMPLLPRWP